MHFSYPLLSSVDQHYLVSVDFELRHPLVSCTINFFNFLDLRYSSKRSLFTRTNLMSLYKTSSCLPTHLDRLATSCVKCNIFIHFISTLRLIRSCAIIHFILQFFTHTCGLGLLSILIHRQFRHRLDFCLAKASCSGRNLSYQTRQEERCALRAEMTKTAKLSSTEVYAFGICRHGQGCLSSTILVVL